MEAQEWLYSEVLFLVGIQLYENFHLFCGRNLSFYIKSRTASAGKTKISDLNMLWETWV